MRPTSHKIRMLMSKKRDAAGFLIMDGGKALILRRSATSNKPGLWNLPGGGMEKGETTEQSAIRELFEETGLRLQNSGWKESLLPHLYLRGVHRRHQSRLEGE